MTDELLSLKKRAREAMKLLDSEVEKVIEKKRKIAVEPKSLTCIQHFRERLMSFCPPQWSVKPHDISPRLFASHGWKCVDRDLLQCVSCREYVCAKLPSLLDVDLSVMKKVIRNLCSKAVTGHTPTCHFRHCTVEDALCNDEEDDPMKGIKRRYSSVKGLDLSGVEVVSFDCIPNCLFSQFPPDSHKHIILACCGWIKSKQTDDALYCDYCFRTLGLWIFRQTSVLNPEKEHQPWCLLLKEDLDDLNKWRKQMARLTSSADKDESLAFQTAKYRRILHDALTPSIGNTGS